jgi:hypothetical protein
MKSKKKRRKNIPKPAATPSADAPVTRTNTPTPPRGEGPAKETLPIPIRRGLRKHAQWALGVVLGLCTLVGTVIELLPRVTPSVSEPPDPDSPFSSSVTIVNSGSIPLYSVSVGVGVHKICVEPTKCEDEDFTKSAQDYRSRITSPDWTRRRLGVDSRFEIPLNGVIKPDPNEHPTPVLNKASVAIIVRYRIPFTFWATEKIFPLALNKQTNGKFYWYWE